MATRPWDDRACGAVRLVGPRPVLGREPFRQHHYGCVGSSIQAKDGVVDGQLRHSLPIGRSQMSDGDVAACNRFIQHGLRPGHPAGGESASRPRPRQADWRPAVGDGTRAAGARFVVSIVAVSRGQKLLRSSYVHRVGQNSNTELAARDVSANASWTRSAVRARTPAGNRTQDQWIKSPGTFVQGASRTAEFGWFELSPCCPVTACSLACHL